MSDTSVEITLLTYRSQDYTGIEPIGNVTFTEQCQSGVRSSFSYVCQYPDGTSYSISSHCDGKNGTLITSCPTRAKIPTCYISSSVASSGSSSCKLLSYTSTSMKCLCQACPSSSSPSRQLKSMEAVTYQILAVTKYMFEDYAGMIIIIILIIILIISSSLLLATMSTATELNPSDVAKSVIVIMSFIAVWAFVVVLVGVQVSIIIIIIIIIVIIIVIVIRSFAIMARRRLKRRRLRWKQAS